MSIQTLRSLCLTALLCILAWPASAELSKEKAAIVEGNKRTQRYLDEQNYEAALLSAESTYELSVQTLGMNNPNTAILAEEYAKLLGTTNNRNQAYKLHKQAVEIFTTLYGDTSVKAVWSLLGMGEYANREDQSALVERALGIQRSAAPDDTMAYADAAVYAGQYLTLYYGDRKLAQKILREALKIYETEYGKDSPEIIQPLMLLGRASTKLGETQSAKRHYRRALGIAEKKHDEGHRAALLSEAGTSLLRFAASREARKYLRQGYELSSRVHGEDDPRTGLAAKAYARYHMADKKPKSAEPLLQQALGALEENSNYRRHQMAVLALLVEVYESQGLREKATPYCQAIGEITPWSKDQDYLPIIKKAPNYPRIAVSAGSEGYVVVEYTVDKYGFVQEPKIVDSTGHKSFHTASLETLDKFRYAPAYVDGKPVATEGVRNKFTFSLE